MPATGYPVKAPKTIWVSAMAFDTNGSSDPASSTWRGTLARYVTSITYSATGIYTIVFSSDLTLPNTPLFLLSPTIASLSEGFVPVQIGAYNATTRTLVVQTVNHNGTAFVGKAVAAPGAAGASSVNIECRVENTTGK